MPLAYVPFMSAPDPTVKRKSGFLFPTLSTTTQYGFGLESHTSGRWRRATT